jgi:LuxR family maltose regulon positive regulatory protein
MGRLHQAFTQCQQVLSLAEQSGQSNSRMPVLAYAYGTMSLVQLEWNEIESAVSSARESVALAEEWKQADALHFALNCLSQALSAAGDLEQAFAVNQRAIQFAKQVSPWFYRLSAVDEIRLELAKGEVALADYKMNELEPLVSERDKKYTFLICKVSLLLTQRKYLEVLSAAAKIIDELEQEELNWYRLTLMPLQALALQALGQESEAFRVISRCLILARPEGFVRIFVDRGAPMFRLLQIALSQGIEIEYIHKLLSAFHVSPDIPVTEIPPPVLIQPTRQTTNLVESLSDREIQVLCLLDSALTNEEIGRELYVSVNTVRTHIRNIYAKLGVNRRGDAVRRAQELNLM